MYSHIAQLDSPDDFVERCLAWLLLALPDCWGLEGWTWSLALLPDCWTSLSAMYNLKVIAWKAEYSHQFRPIDKLIATWLHNAIPETESKTKYHKA